MMKIKYFSYLAEQSFKTSPSGERLFYHSGGFWSKPYLISDEETEKRLYKKQLWLWRIFGSALILGQPFLFIAVPEIIKTPLGYILYFAVVILLYRFVNWLVFRKDLSLLNRAESCISFSAFYRDSAKKHSTFGLILGFLASICFVWAGAWIIKSDFNPFAGWMAISFFGFCAVAWGYTLLLKLNMPRNNEYGTNKAEA